MHCDCIFVMLVVDFTNSLQPLTELRSPYSFVYMMAAHSALHCELVSCSLGKSWRPLSLQRSVGARHFQVPASTLSDWEKLDSERDHCSSPRVRREGAGRKVSYGEEMDSEILTWVLDWWEQQLPVTISLLCAYALKQVKEKFPDHQFNASCGWGTKFLRRQNLSLRMRTSVVQTLPADL